MWLMIVCIDIYSLSGSGISEVYQKELCKIADQPYEEREIAKVLGLEKSSVSQEVCSDSSVEKGNGTTTLNGHGKKNGKTSRKEEKEDEEIKSTQKNKKKAKITATPKKSSLTTNGKKKGLIKSEKTSKRSTGRSKTA